MTIQASLSPSTLGILAERLGPLPLINHFLARMSYTTRLGAPIRFHLDFDKESNMADYTGFPITERGDAWGRYTGSTLIGAQGAECAGWHHLQQAGFAEYDTAAAYALAAAKRAIDANPDYGVSP